MVVCQREITTKSPQFAMCGGGLKKTLSFAVSRDFSLPRIFKVRKQKKRK